MMTEGKMTDSQEFSKNGTSGDSDFNPNVDPEANYYQVKETELAKTSEVNNLYARVSSIICSRATPEGAVRIDFASRELDSGAWLTPTQAAELIQLLQATFVK